MNIADVQSSMIEVAAYGSAAILLVLALRRPLRSAFGAGIAYLAWALVPMAMVSSLLPAVTILPATVPGARLTPAATNMLGMAVSPHGVSVTVWAVRVIWLIGVISAAAILLWRQRRFVRSLGHIAARDDGTYVAQASAGLPAVIGILRPLIVLPADHAVRFDPEQQQLVRDHEQVHIARGDQVSNLFAAVLRCLFWFNPLVYWAGPRFRQDQELACDARVIARHPHARRVYGEALLRVHLPALAAPLSCQIGFAHPLKERFAMLKQPMPTRAKRAAGFVAVLVLGAVGGLVANAAQGPNTGVDRPRRVIYTPPPGNFRSEALSLGVSGKVVVFAEFDETGRVVSAEIEKSDPAGVFDEVALEYARQVRIEPLVKDGVPVRTRLHIPVRFQQNPTPK